MQSLPTHKTGASTKEALILKIPPLTLVVLVPYKSEVPLSLSLREEGKRVLGNKEKGAL